MHELSESISITPSGAATSKLVADRASIAMKGHRREMEDKVIDAWFWTRATSNRERSADLKEAVHVAGVFDGHCSDQAASFAATELVPMLRRHFDGKSVALEDRVDDGTKRQRRPSMVGQARGSTKGNAGVEIQTGGVDGGTGESSGLQTGGDHEVAVDAARALSALQNSWRELCDKFTSTGKFAGTTACVAVLVETAIRSREQDAQDFAVNLLLLNCGDSRAIFIQPEEGDDHVRFSTVDHTMDSSDEVIRIEDSGGVVDCRGEGQPRLALGDWRLALPRAMTHRDWLGAGVSDTADLYSWPLHLSTAHAHQGTLIIASDGLWGSLAREEAAMIVTQSRRDGLSAKETARRLCETAEKQGSQDNISAVVWFL